MALAWKACWVNALASSNLASSAIIPLVRMSQRDFSFSCTKIGVIGVIGQIVGYRPDFVCLTDHHHSAELDQ